MCALTCCTEMKTQHKTCVSFFATLIVFVCNILDIINSSTIEMCAHIKTDLIDKILFRICKLIWCSLERYAPALNTRCTLIPIRSRRTRSCQIIMLIVPLHWWIVQKSDQVILASAKQKFTLLSTFQMVQLLFLSLCMALEMALMVSSLFFLLLLHHFCCSAWISSWRSQWTNYGHYARQCILKEHSNQCRTMCN